MKHGGRLAPAIAVAVAMACGAAAPAAEVVPVVTGTAHQALFAVALDGQLGLAVGAAGQVLTTADAGQTWKPTATPATDKALLGVALGGGRAIVVGQEGTLLLADDAGNWRSVVSGTGERLFGVAFNRTGVAVAVGSFGTILRSGDGGDTWSSIAPVWSEGEYTEQGLEPHMYAVDVAADGTITCGGEFGLILRSTDAGATWLVLHKGEASVFALELRPDGVGYAVGQGGLILRSTDSGATWAEVASGSTANLLGVKSAVNGQVAVTAMRDMLVSDDGITWQRIEGGDFGSAWYAGVAMARQGDRDAALVVGHAGRIVRVGR